MASSSKAASKATSKASSKPMAPPAPKGMGQPLPMVPEGAPLDIQQQLLQTMTMLLAQSRQQTAIMNQMALQLQQQQELLEAQHAQQSAYQWTVSQKISNLENRQCWQAPDESSVVRAVCQYAEGSSWGISPQCVTQAVQSIRNQRTPYKKH